MQLTIKQQKPLFRGNTLVYTSIAALLSYTLTGCGSADATPSTGENTLDLSDKTEGVTVSIDNMQWYPTADQADKTSFNDSIHHVILTSSNDHYTGNAESNISWLGAGDDDATTNNGNDTVYTGAGADIIKTGNHNDTIYAYGGGQKSINSGNGDDRIEIAIDSDNTTVKIEQFNAGGDWDKVRMIVIDPEKATPTADDISTYKDAGLKVQIISYENDIPDAEDTADSKFSVAADIGLIMVTDVVFADFDVELGASIKEYLPSWFEFEEDKDAVFIYVTSSEATQAYLYSFQDTNNNMIMESGEILQIADISGHVLVEDARDSSFYGRMFPDFDFSDSGV